MCSITESRNLRKKNICDPRNVELTQECNDNNLSLKICKRPGTQLVQIKMGCIKGLYHTCLQNASGFHYTIL